MRNPIGVGFRARSKHPWIIVHCVHVHNAFLLDAYWQNGPIPAGAGGDGHDLFEDPGDRVAVSMPERRTFMVLLWRPGIGSVLTVFRVADRRVQAAP